MKSTHLAMIIVGVGLTILAACSANQMDLDPISKAPSLAGSNSSGNEPSKIFSGTEKQPSFPGGNKALLEYMEKNLKYPKDYDGCAQGRVVVSFFVEVDGSISDPQVVRGLDGPLDAEALRLVRSMPKFIPGTILGQRVRMRCNIPVIFKLH